MNVDFLLIQKIKNGDPQAGEQFVRKYYSAIYQYCFLHIHNSYDAEDMTQETFLSIYKSLESFDGDNPGGFVTRVAVNKCLDYLKRADRRAVPSEDSVLAQNLPYTPPPEDNILQEEARCELLKACNTLKPPYNEVATNYYCNGMTAPQIAGITGKKLKTVQTQIRRAKELLRKKIRKEDII